jgi:hypothetical protein
MMLISPLNSDAIFSCACCGILYYGDQIFEDFFSRRLGGEESLIPVNHYYPQHKYICKSCRGKRVVLGTKSVKLNIMPGNSFFVVNLFFLFFWLWWLHC